MRVSCSASGPSPSRRDYEARGQRNRADARNLATLFPPRFFGYTFFGQCQKGGPCWYGEGEYDLYLKLPGLSSAKPVCSLMYAFGAFRMVGQRYRIEAHGPAGLMMIRLDT
jgi:hypothetical protein